MLQSRRQAKRQSRGTSTSLPRHLRLAVEGRQWPGLRAQSTSSRLEPLHELENLQAVKLVVRCVRGDEFLLAFGSWTSGSLSRTWKAKGRLALNKFTLFIRLETKQSQTT